MPAPYPCSDDVRHFLDPKRIVTRIPDVMNDAVEGKLVLENAVQQAMSRARPRPSMRMSRGPYAPSAASLPKGRCHLVYGVDKSYATCPHNGPCWDTVTSY